MEVDGSDDFPDFNWGDFEVQEALIFGGIKIQKKTFENHLANPTPSLQRSQRVPNPSKIDGRLGCHSFQFRTRCSFEGTVHTNLSKEPLEDSCRHRGPGPGISGKPSEFAVQFFFRKHLEYQSGKTSLALLGTITGSPLFKVRI